MANRWGTNPWALAAFGAGIAATTPAWSQGLLPAVGADVRVGDLRDQFTQAFPGLGGAAAPAWTFVPSLDISETYDNGVLKRNGRYGTDYITRVSPGITIAGEGGRVTGSFSYTPSLNVYAVNGNLNGVTQNLSSQATITAVENWLYLDLRGYAAEQALNGGGGAYGGGSGANSVQTANFSIAPSIRHSFGGTGSIDIGYSLTRSIISNQQNVATGSPYLSPTNGQNVTTNAEHAIFATGENFGRFGNTLSINGSQTEGSGTLNGAYNYSISNQLTYAISRFVAVFGSIGYEDIFYPATTGGTPEKIKDMTWSVGTTLTPNDNSTLTVSYGKSQGNTNFTVNGNLMPTARTQVALNYSEGLQTGFQQLQNTIAGAVLSPAGYYVNATTGAPILNTANLFGTQTALYRVTSASISGTLLYTLDTFTASAVYNDSVPQSTGTGAGFANGGVFGTLGWTHILSESVTATSGLTVGNLWQPGTGISTNITGNIQVTYNINETLRSYLQYSHTQVIGTTFFGEPASHDIATIGLHKSF